MYLSLFFSFFLRLQNHFSRNTDRRISEPSMRESKKKGALEPNSNLRTLERHQIKFPTQNDLIVQLIVFEYAHTWTWHWFFLFVSFFV